MTRYAESMFLPVADDVVDRWLSWAVAGAIASFLVLYILTPWAYAAGPALLFLIALPYLGFARARVAGKLDRESVAFIASLLGYFIAQAVILTVHGEDVSEYDLSFRYLAASVVLLFLLTVPVSGRQLLIMASIGGLLSGSTALYQVATGSVARLQTFDNPIHYGNGALALGALSLAGLLWVPPFCRAMVWRGLLVLSLIGGVAASLLSGTRSGWAAIPLMALVTLVAFRDRLPSMKWWLPLVVLVTSLLLIGLAEVDSVKQRVMVAVEELEGYIEEGQNHTSVGIRLDMYKAGWVTFGEGPLIGVGPTEKVLKVEELITEGEIHPKVARFRHLHNQYIDTMAHYGVVGLAAYLALMVIPFCLFYRKARMGPPGVRALGLAGTLFLTLHAVVNLTQSMLERNMGTMMFVFMMVFLWAALKHEERTASSAAQSN